MSGSALLEYARSILVHIPWTHWVVMGVVALTVFLLTRKKCSVYGAIALGVTVFVGLLLLETAVVIRYFGLFRHSSGVKLYLSFDRLFHGTSLGRMENFVNVAVFVPLGFFLAEFLATTKRHAAWRRILFGTLAAFGLSLCIECLQLVLHVGYFELMDLVLNTVGGAIGAGVSVGVRKVVSARCWAAPSKDE